MEIEDPTEHEVLYNEPDTVDATEEQLEMPDLETDDTLTDNAPPEMPDLADLLGGIEIGMLQMIMMEAPMMNDPFMGGGIPASILQDLIEGDDEPDGDRIEEITNADGSHIHKEIHKQGNMRSVSMTIDGGSGIGGAFGMPPPMMPFGDPFMDLIMADMMMGMQDGMAMGRDRKKPQKQ